jgi:hypothetical protein
MTARELFEAELTRRGATWSVEGDGRGIVSVGGMRILVSLDNLDRQLAAGGAEGKTVEAFTTGVLAEELARAVLCRLLPVARAAGGIGPVFHQTKTIGFLAA